MPLKKRSKVLVIETGNPKKNIVPGLEDLELSNKSIKASLVKSEKKIDLLKKTIDRL